jgi:hypothetical protein
MDIDGRKNVKSLARQAKTRTRRHRPYIKTPARLAASLANLKRARAAPKDLVYRPTVKRLLAYRANLLKALKANRERRAAGQWSQDDPDHHPGLAKRRSLATGEVPDDDASKNFR